jgi:hypothetical protein
MKADSDASHFRRIEVLDVTICTQRQLMTRKHVHNYRPPCPDRYCFSVSVYEVWAWDGLGTSCILRILGSGSLSNCHTPQCMEYGVLVYYLQNNNI